MLCEGVLCLGTTTHGQKTLTASLLALTEGGSLPYAGISFEPLQGRVVIIACLSSSCHKSMTKNLRYFPQYCDVYPTLTYGTILCVRLGIKIEFHFLQLLPAV